jgi:two-component system OmpR family response regulator
MPHILIVDDDLDIRQLLQRYLEKNAFTASSVADGAGMWACLDNTQIDLITLDLMLKNEDGLELCRQLQADTTIPVIILSALGEDTDKIVGLEMGADDYVPKPFNPRELLARIKAILRRQKTSVTKKEQPPKDITALCFNDWRLDFNKRDLYTPEQHNVLLSAGEFRLLKVLLEHPKHILNRDQLLELSQGREAQAFDRSIDVLIGRLRKHLNEDAKHPQIIVTERGVGYRLAADVVMCYD